MEWKILFRDLLECRNIQIHFKAIHLATKGVAFNLDIHQFEQRLVTLGIVGDENGTSAGPPQGMLFPKGAQGRHEFVGSCQFTDGGGFTSGDDQSLQSSQLFGQAHLHNLAAEVFQHVLVFNEIALKCENADFHGLQMDIIVKVYDTD